ncbi:hypothetical protein L6164_004192 [Bauhinia variegata]|uniref:Uncharacterized protein n=1 Tax=Bauhinia variegata TaxID=167791 RepID=A0ACB9Q3X1_BAUVA|nr:hypothetical protein L6164_004192 [Bauhinia variegata]
MAEQFSSCVEFGLQLSKRIYYGKGAVPAPAEEQEMSRSPERYLPTAPMCYAVIREPELVDNPDIRSYQPYVHGGCEPPALIPLQMHGVSVDVDCCLDTAFITVGGTWRVHCVRTSAVCDCRIAVPMGEQGSLLGVEVDHTGRSYQTELITLEDEKHKEKAAKSKDGYFLKSQIYTVKIPQVNGGSFLSIKIRWSQKLFSHDSQLSLRLPFSFPAYVNPVAAGQKISKKEMIYLKLNSGITAEVLCKSTSHPLKELTRQEGKLSFSYEAEVPVWSSTDFSFSYTVSSSDIFGAVLLQSPFLGDFDQREMFCMHLYPENGQNRKVFRRDVVFILDISASMRGSPLENAKNALLASLSQLNVHDTFNIIAFNEEEYLFSSSMEVATERAILNATQWVDANFIAKGGTNILLPLTQAMKLFQKTTDSVPLIFLITDGAVENEREICNFVKSYVTQSVCTPRLCTFGIGLYCNHYFLQMLAQIGRGHFDAAHDLDSIDFRIQRLFRSASSVIVANISVEGLESLDSLELFPIHIPDLSLGSPLIISGRYDGTFPDSVKVSGTLAEMSSFVIELKVQRAKDMQLSNVLAKRHIDMITARAWLLESKELEEKVSKMSIQNKLPSEYACPVLVKTDKGNKAPEPFLIQKAYNKLSLQNMEPDSQKIFLGGLGVGFGNLKATAENLPPAVKEAKPSAGILEKAASNCCSRMANHCCGMYLIQACSFVNEQCTIVCTQLCTALACFELAKCCFELCECECF